jgi:sulfatase modifying factor 1
MLKSVATKDLVPTFCRPAPHRSDFCAMNCPPTPLEWTAPINLARENDFALGQFEVCPSRSQVLVNGTTETVEPRVMQALVVLVQRKSQVVSRDELVGRCWGGRVVSEDAIHRCIAKVRKLGELDRSGSFMIETVPRVGYQLNEIHSDGVQGLGASLDQLATEPILATSIRKEGYGQYKWPVLGTAVLVISLVTAAILWFFRPTAIQAPTLNNRSAAVTVVSGGSSALPAGAIFKDCTAGCPEMVVVPSGYFGMGSTHSESDKLPSDVPGVPDNEGPEHEVLIAHRFAVARYDVTREEYARFVDDTHLPDGSSCQTLLPTGLFIETVGASWRHPGFSQTVRDPVVCVNWADARAYAAWLSRRTANPYRLLTEAEWEYAARAGSNLERTREGTPSAPCQAFNGGDRDYHSQYPGDRLVDFDCRDGYSATSPVGRFPANAFGLFDMQGNVWQWTEDCYHQSYDGAPSDGSAWLEANCTSHVVRGNSWTDDPRSIRFARRGFGTDEGRFSSNGIRVARSL